MHFVTFSRALGSGGAEIARRVADELGYKFCDTAAIENAAREMGFLESVREIDEKAPSFFRRFFSHKPEISLDRLNSVVYDLARQGDAVFLGRGSQILLKSFECALHVRVTASVEKRILNLTQRGFQREAASKALKESDQERSGFIRYAFGKDWNEPETYDIVLNMDKLSADLAVSTVLHLARSNEINACSADAMRSLEMLALAGRAEAAVIEAGMSYGHGMHVSVDVAEPGKVRLRGTVEEKTSKMRAQEVVNSVEGVESVENQIRVVIPDRHS
jgi:cytidylate kinase